MADIMTYADDTDQIQEISQHIVISRDKSVYVPEIIRKSIVYRDRNVERLTFDCPRYWSGIDISELNIYVNYIAEGQKKKKEDPGSFLCENVIVDEDNTEIFHFDWRITSNASEFPDKLIFLVCAKSVDAEGNEDVHWNSHLCKDLEVQEGLEASDSIVNKYPDVIESILSKLGKQIELRNSGIAIQYRNAGENIWTDLVQLEDIKGDAAVIIESNFKGSDTTANIIAKTGETGDKWYSTDEGVYYMINSFGEWIDCGSGENLKKIEDEIAELKGDIEQLKQSGGSGSGSGFSDSTITRLINIMRAGVYTSDQSDNITALEADLRSSGSSGETSAYTVINNLTNVSNNNSATSVPAGESYTAVLTADNGYTLDTVSVTMGGVEQTVADGVINISVVTGNIVITATATGSPVLVSNEKEWNDGVEYTFEWVDGEYVTPDGTYRAYDGWSRTPKLYCAGASSISCHNSGATTQYNCFYDSDGAFLSKFSIGGSTTIQTNVPDGAYYFVLSATTGNLSNIIPHA